MPYMPVGQGPLTLQMCVLAFTRYTFISFSFAICARFEGNHCRVVKVWEFFALEEDFAFLVFDWTLTMDLSTEEQICRATD